MLNVMPVPPGTMGVPDPSTQLSFCIQLIVNSPAAEVLKIALPGTAAVNCSDSDCTTHCPTPNVHRNWFWPTTGRIATAIEVHLGQTQPRPRPHRLRHSYSWDGRRETKASELGFRVMDAALSWPAKVAARLQITNTLAKQRTVCGLSDNPIKTGSMWCDNSDLQTSYLIAPKAIGAPRSAGKAIQQPKTRKSWKGGRPQRKCVHRKPEGVRASADWQAEEVEFVSGTRAEGCQLTKGLDIVVMHRRA